MHMCIYSQCIKIIRPNWWVVWSFYVLSVLSWLYIVDQLPKCGQIIIKCYIIFFIFVLNNTTAANILNEMHYMKSIYISYFQESLLLCKAVLAFCALFLELSRGILSHILLIISSTLRYTMLVFGFLSLKEILKK